MFVCGNYDPYVCVWKPLYAPLCVGTMALIFVCENYGTYVGVETMVLMFVSGNHGTFVCVWELW